jgi:hypothetical protein
VRHLATEPDNYEAISRCNAIRGSEKLLVLLTAEVDSNMRLPKGWRPPPSPTPPRQYAVPKGYQRKFSRVDDESAAAQAYSIQCKVADYFDTTVADLVGPSRIIIHCRPRMVGMYVMWVKTKFSLPQIARLFGGRDHTTAVNAYRKISAGMLTDEQLAFDVAWLIEAITGEQQ